MADITVRDRLQYSVDRLFTRGGPAMIVALAVASALLVMGAGLVVALARLHPPDSEPLSLSEAAWGSLMRTLDPGTMGADQGWGFRWTMFAVTLGGIFVISALIGTITSSIESKLDQLGKGRTRVIESGHTLILGWSSQVFTLVGELVVANQNRARGRIVVLGEQDKGRMEDQLASRIDNTLGTRIICRTGSAIDPGDLDLVSIDTARSIIVVSPESSEPDSDVIKTILAITRRRQRREEPYHVVAAIRDEDNVAAAEIAAGRGHEVAIVRSTRAVARVLAQTCRQPGLATVYAEILDFAGDEIYFHSEPRLVGHTYAEALHAYEDSALIGVHRLGGGVLLNPPGELVIGDGDQVVAISADDDTVRLADAIAPDIDTSAIIETVPRRARPERILVLGWNWRAPIIIRELDQYVAPGSEVSVVSAQDVRPVLADEMIAGLANLSVDIRQADPTKRGVLSGLPLRETDHVILLSDTSELDAQHADARTLLTLLHLRDLAARSSYGFSIVTEVRDPRNQRLAEASIRADDFVISDRLVSQVMAQVSENGALYDVLIDFFDPEGVEIYLKPAGDYVALDREVTFHTVVAAAVRRGETAIGYRLVGRDAAVGLGHGVVLNPRKGRSVRFAAEDRIIVLAEN